MRGEDWIKYHCLRAWLERMKSGEEPMHITPNLPDGVNEARHAERIAREEAKLEALLAACDALDKFDAALKGDSHE